jgi:CubicO group peptidase (beta-lactamase class C family)
MLRSVSRRRFLQQTGAMVLSASSLQLSLKAWAGQTSASLKSDVPAIELIASLSRLIPELMKQHRVPGLSIAIIRDAKIIWNQGFGLKSTATKEPVSSDTIFEAASLSKPAFAYAALKLCEKNKLGLDTPLAEYLPEAWIPNEPRLKLITARTVLSHTSGLPHGRPPGTAIALRFTPGEQFYYSASGFQYLQSVVERVSNQSLTDFMRANLLRPFEMHSSNFGWLKRFERESAQGHDREGNPGLSGNGKYLKMTPEQRAQSKRDYPEYAGAATASAGLYTTATDFAKFMIEIIAPPKQDQFRLSESMTSEMLKPQVRLDKNISWGLGWGIEHTDAGDGFWHWGDWGVFRNFAVAFKKQRIGAVVLTNSFHGPKVYSRVVPEAIGGDHPAFSWVSNYRS